jgi:hypothetical protein
MVSSLVSQVMNVAHHHLHLCWVMARCKGVMVIHFDEYPMILMLGVENQMMMMMTMLVMELHHLMKRQQQPPACWQSQIMMTLMAM